MIIQKAKIHLFLNSTKMKAKEKSDNIQLVGQRKVKCIDCAS